MKKNGVKNANATTRSRSCSLRCSWKCRLITSPRMKAGRTACPFEASARVISTRRHTKMSFISGSITRFP